MTVGVAISTHRRPDTLAWALEGWAQHMPDVLVVNHDRDGNGVAHTKNQGIAALMDAGCTELFLADDDLKPRAADWWRPYVDSPIPHLQYLWNGKIREARDGWQAKNTFHGCLLYAHRTVIEKVGGMRTDWPAPFGYEHVEWSRRIHAAGLTPHRYIDVENSTRLWHSLDQAARAGGPPHASSVGPNRKQIAAANLDKLARHNGSTDYVDYR